MRGKLILTAVVLLVIVSGSLWIAAGSTNAGQAGVAPAPAAASPDQAASLGPANPPGTPLPEFCKLSYCSQNIHQKCVLQSGGRCGGTMMCVYAVVNDDSCNTPGVPPTCATGCI